MSLKLVTDLYTLWFNLVSPFFYSFRFITGINIVFYVQRLWRFVKDRHFRSYHTTFGEQERVGPCSISTGVGIVPRVSSPEVTGIKKTFRLLKTYVRRPLDRVRRKRNPKYVSMTVQLISMGPVLSSRHQRLFSDFNCPFFFSEETFKVNFYQIYKLLIVVWIDV